MSELFERRLYCLLGDGTMHYPVFVEARKGTDPVTIEDVKKLVAEQYGVPFADLEILCYPRWAVRLPLGPHVAHVGMIPADPTGTKD